ncbi:YncE family protein [Alteriqipengyuania lutimaris]|uniref:YncE family protein n=1 Tax=Alteriqipengyuania lutimaris TaxID=1538146 RepID=A0A395LFY8_9SPHN|nr:YncE family protein [Alteriqipengyuania lutimaris]MBB3035086.1 YVTN family beta-propeller protein [Alteriqipengyuania lutimaris]RDS75706.1 YncE family protein [Alteriqipengyuania lutimaris]
MNRPFYALLLLAGSALAPLSVATAGQPPRSATAPDVAISARDRIYAADQFSNTVSVIDPATNRLLGVIRLGDPQPANLSPLYRGQLLVHGLGFSPDGKTLAVVSIGSNSVTFIDTATNAVKATTYVGRSPHEAFFTPDGRELWVTIRGEDYVAVIDTTTFAETKRIRVPAGPGMQIFSPDGDYGYVCSSFTAETVAIRLADHQIVGRIRQDSPFCPNIAASPDGTQVWLTLKDIGRVMIFDARPPFKVIHTIDTGPLTNHVNFAQTAAGTFAYVTVGGLNAVRVFSTDSFEETATIPVGKLPHGLWPSGDGSRIYVGLENADMIAAIDTSSNRVVAEIPVGQAPQAVVYVPNAVAKGDGTAGLTPPGLAAQSVQLSLYAVGSPSDSPSTSVTLFDQGLTQVLQAAVAGLEPRKPYVLALAEQPDGSGAIEPLASFTTNPAGSAVVNAVGPIRQVVRDAPGDRSRFLVIVPGSMTEYGPPVQLQSRAS